MITFSLVPVFAVYDFRFLYVGEFWLTPGIFALTKELGKPMRYFRCCLKLSAYVYICRFLRTHENNSAAKCVYLVPCNWNFLIWGMLFPNRLSLFARFYARGVTNFRWQFPCQNNYLSGFLSGVIILFLFEFHMAQE